MQNNGEKQKTACASVSALLPEIMILDESSSDLGWKAISELKNIISLRKSQGRTVIISEHRLWYRAGMPAKLRQRLDIPRIIC